MPKKDPFAEFEDWLVDGPAGEWPESWEPEKEFTSEQQRIIKNNAILLLDRDAWKKHVDAFEWAIQALPGEDKKNQRRAKYIIRFDKTEFEDGDKDFYNYHFPCSVSFREARFG